MVLLWSIFRLKGTAFFEAENLICGIPQEFMLVPLSILLYMNYILQALLNTHAYLYADDISIFYRHKDATEV